LEMVPVIPFKLSYPNDPYIKSRIIIIIIIIIFQRHLENT